MADMTKEERRAAELRFAYNQLPKPKVFYETDIERLLSAAVSAERERCAKVAEAFESIPSDRMDYGEIISAAIRQGGE